MKRDMDLIRKILFFVEEKYDGNLLVTSEIEDCDSNRFLYHCKLLLDCGLIDGKITKFISGNGIIECKGLTWMGQEYLAGIRNDKVWNKIKKTIIDKGIDFTLDIVAKLSAKYTKEFLNLD